MNESINKLVIHHHYHPGSSKKGHIVTGLLIGTLTYSIYIQALKIDQLSKEIEELKNQKGD